jgi:hypothetical protein
MGRYTGGKERVCGVSKESNSTAFRNPRGQRISKHEFEIDESAFGCLLDDGSTSRIPTLDYLECVFYFPRESPRLLGNVLFVL